MKILHKQNHDSPFSYGGKIEGNQKKMTRKKYNFIEVYIFFFLSGNEALNEKKQASSLERNVFLWKDL